MGNIRYKGGNYTRDTRSSYVQVEPLSVTANGTYTAESGKAYNPISVNVGLPQPVSENDVTFYDYDGTVAYSYSVAEFAELESMPANPTHEGLTSQGWNWSLSDAKQYVADYGKLNIGQMYTTSDGKTHAVIQLEEGRLSPTLGLELDGTATIDWGDGTTPDTMTGSSLSTQTYLTHNYPHAGIYTISIDITGNAEIGGALTYSYFLSKNTANAENMVYENALKAIYLGDNISLKIYSFNACYSLASIIIPTTMTSFGNYGDGIFWNCRALTHVIIPNTFTFIGYNVFENCSMLKSIIMPNTLTSIGGGTCKSCYALKDIIIPSSVTSIENSAFYDNRTLSHITIPDSVTSIGTKAFYNDCGLGTIKFTSTTPPTVADSNAWKGIPTDCKILVPQGTLETYKAAQNYPNPSTYTYEEYT